MCKTRAVHKVVGGVDGVLQTQCRILLPEWIPLWPCGVPLGMTDLEKEIELVNDYSSEPTELFVFAGTYEPDLVPSGLLWRLSPMDQHAQVD